MARTTTAAYTTENITLVLDPSPDGVAYNYENITHTFSSEQDAFAYTTERIVLTSSNLQTEDAVAYAYENLITQDNPTQLKMWDGSQWVRKPWYVWNDNTGSWEQAT